MSEMKVTGALAERTTPTSFGARRAIKLRRNEREDFRDQQMIEAAVALFLDLENEHTWATIAEELGITVQQLKFLTKLDQFDEIYNQHFAELGHDPRLKATQAELSNLLPAAMRELRKLVIQEGTPATVRLSAIKELFRLVGVEQPKGEGASRKEVADFLHDAGINIGTVNVNPMQVPEEYQGILDGEVIDVPDVIVPDED
jgi:hypothetical protein